MTKPRRPRYRPPLPYVQRSGEHHYFRRHGFPRRRLPGLPLSPEYMAAYNAAYRQALDTSPPSPIAPSLPAPSPDVTRAQGVRSYVYIIGHPEDGPVKIGVSAKPRDRLRDLQIGNPVKLKILAKFRGGPDQEAAAHRLLGTYRIQGEWFARSGVVLTFIDNVSRGNGMTIDPGPHDNPWLVDLYRRQA